MKLLICVQLFVTPWTIAYQVPLSMGFSRQEYWNGLPFPSPGDLPHPGIQPTSPALAGKLFTTEPQGSPNGMRGTGNFVFCDLFGNRWVYLFCNNSLSTYDLCTLLYVSFMSIQNFKHFQNLQRPYISYLLLWSLCQFKKPWSYNFLVFNSHLGPR